MTATSARTDDPKPQPPVLARLLRGTFWLALKTPLQAIFAFWSVPLILRAIGEDENGAYNFAWGFGFIQFLLEFGMSSALQKQVSETWTRGDREGVDRAVAVGATFYAVVAAVQTAALLGIAYGLLPRTDYRGDSYRLIVKLLWLQALTAPCFGLSTVVSAVLQAARRYDFIPRFELLVICARFAILVVGLRLGVDFFLIVVAQTLAQIALTLAPALWVMDRELGYRPRWFRGVRWADFRALSQFSGFVFMIQLSVVLADKLDKTILGFLLRDPGPATTVYEVVGKPFMQIRQCGWMLSYLVMPAVAGLVAARDLGAIERLKYDGARLLAALLLPVGLLAGIHARPFLLLWVGRYGEHAHLLRLFLVAALPLLISIHVQMCIGMGDVRVVACWALAGAAVNLVLSCALTLAVGMPGVIWGTVLTTLISNLVGPGIHVFKVLKIDLRSFFSRTLGAPLLGSLALVAASGLLAIFFPCEVRGATFLAKAWPLLAHLTVGCLAYAVGYLAAPTGRSDLRALILKLSGRTGSRIAQPALTETIVMDEFVVEQVDVDEI